MKKQAILIIDGNEYPVTITTKRMRSLTLRFDPETKTFRVSAPYLTPMPVIKDFVSRRGPALLKKVCKKEEVYDGHWLYYLGNKVEVGDLDAKGIDAYYVKNGLPYLRGRVAFYAKKMGVDLDYRVRMRKMKRTFGSNSRATKRLTFQTRLLAFSPEVVDSVVVHELAHHFRFDHSPAFYAIVYAHCPDYDKLRKRLIHGQYA